MTKETSHALGHDELSPFLLGKHKKRTVRNARLIVYFILVRFHNKCGCAANSLHHPVLKGAWVIAAPLPRGLYETAHRSPRAAFFCPRWCHIQRLPEHKVHSHSPPSDMGPSTKQAVSIATAASGRGEVVVIICCLWEEWDLKFYLGEQFLC